MAQEEVQNGGAHTAAIFTSVKPQLLVQAPKASDAVQFYKTAFGAEEIGRTLHPKRKADQELPLVLFAELKLAGFTILVSDLPEESAEKTDGSGIVICLETEDVSSAIAKAVKAGAIADGEVTEGDETCFGGRIGKLKDPYGFVWHICSPAKKRAQEEKPRSPSTESVFCHVEPSSRRWI